MKRAALNLTSVIGGEILLRGANFAAVVVMARLYGPKVLGVYATVIAFVTVAVMIADNGLQVSSIREIAQQPGRLGQTLGELYFAKTLLFAVMTTILAALAIGLKFPAEIWWIGAFISLRTMLYSYCQLHAGVLKALDHMLLIGMVQLMHFGLLLTGVGLAYFRHWPVALLLGWLLAGQTSELLASGAIIFRFGIRPRWSSWSECSKTLHRSTPIGVTYSAAALILRADVIVLSWLVSSHDLGYFAAANIPLVMIYVVSWLFGGAILPRMLMLASDPQALRVYSNRWITVLLLTTTPLSVIQLAITPRLIHFVYGAAFASTGKLAAIMGLAVPFILANSVWLSRAIASGSSASYFGPYLGTGILTLLLDYLLGIGYGAVGIAVAIVIREIVLFTVFAAIQNRSAREPEIHPMTNSTFLSVSDSNPSGSLR